MRIEKKDIIDQPEPLIKLHAFTNGSKDKAICFDTDVIEHNPICYNTSHKQQIPAQQTSQTEGGLLSQILSTGTYIGDVNATCLDDLKAIKGRSIIKGNITIDCKDSDIHDFSILQQLQKVDGYVEIRNARLLDLKGFEGLKQVTEGLRLISSDFVSLDGLNNIQSVGTLYIHCCQSLKNLDALENLQEAELIRIAISRDLESIAGLQHTKRIGTLWLETSDKLPTLKGIDQLTHIDKLCLHFLDSLKDITALSRMTSIGILEITNCKALPNLYGLENVKKIDQFKLQIMHQLTHLQELAALERAKLISITSSRNIKNLHDLINLKQLGSLEVDCKSQPFPADPRQAMWVPLH